MSSDKASRKLRSGIRWMCPVTLNGGMEINASSGIFGVRSSGAGATDSLTTANRTDVRFTWANSARSDSPRVPNSSVVTSDSTRNRSSARLSMSVTRRWRVAMIPRTTNESV